ncbi:MAG: hypothetical protein Q8M09_13625 [Pseudomonadota bacterium]|nr:hypothetical protein [Pseudomonadota bacterium]MDP1905267.1 hypothetical protein [Pseudomonadota bacterium]MDP2352553.1 hypothetical protein [Pseudomonadota bacterium]
MTAAKWIVYMGMIMLASGGALAGGGKVRGENGQGDVVQNQIRNAAPTSPYVAVTPVVAPEPEPVLPEYDEMVQDELTP